jgi:hypothetical protein
MKKTKFNNQKEYEDWRIAQLGFDKTIFNPKRTIKFNNPSTFPCILIWNITIIPFDDVGFGFDEERINGEFVYPLDF